MPALDDNCELPQPVYPEVDIALLQGGTPTVMPTGPSYSNPNFGIPNDQAQPEVDVTLLPGVPGQRGPSGVLSVVSPITNSGNSTHAVLGIDQTLLEIASTQVTGNIPSTQISGPIPASQISGLPSVTTFVFTQNSLSSTWDITHNMGYYPQVVVQDSAGTTIEGAVTYTSLNELIINFVAHGASLPVAGKAYLS
jgi:hypothetical protein